MNEYGDYREEVGATQRYEIIEKPSENGALYSDGFRGNRTRYGYDRLGNVTISRYIYPSGYICNVCKTPYDGDRESCQECGAQGPFYD